jgi:hypothetical protein
MFRCVWAAGIILQAHWPAVEAVALELRRRRELCGREVRELVRAATS